MTMPDKPSTILPSPQLWAALGSQHCTCCALWYGGGGEESQSLLQTGNGRLSSTLSAACLLQPTCPSCRFSLRAPFPPTTSPSVLKHNTEPVAVIFIIIPPKTKCCLEVSLSLTNRSQLGARVGPSEDRGPVSCQRGLGLKP